MTPETSRDVHPDTDRLVVAWVHVYGAQPAVPVLARYYADQGPPLGDGLACCDADDGETCCPGWYEAPHYYDGGDQTEWLIETEDVIRWSEVP